VFQQASSDKNERNRILIEWAVCALKLVVDDVKFVQIGAHDGKHGDPIFRHVTRHQWTGWLCEPVPHYFNKLVKSYEECPNAVPCNVAISSEEIEREIYHLDHNKESQAPKWGKAIASFDKEYVTKHLSADLVRSQLVKCLPFSLFAERQKITEFDLLLIDVEGHEVDVLSTINLNLYKPSLVIIEHYHNSFEDMAVIERQLREYGMILFKGYKDLVALKPNLLDSEEIIASLATSE
jgi:FkbM family methyltransferase